MDLKWRIGFAITAVASVLIFILSLYDIISLQQRLRIWLYISIGLVVVSILLFLLMYRCSRKQMDPVLLFERTLHGGLYHFKCPRCDGMFAVKESRKNDLRSLKLTCPDCGAIGRISSNPPRTIERIPTQKSPRVAFFCQRCGERLNIWAEGSSLVKDISIYSCPYCGSDEPMKRQQ